MTNLDLIQNILEFIDANIGSKITIDTISNLFHYSKFHLHRLFNFVVGLSIAEYIRRRRLEFTYNDLIMKSSTISEISFGYGFDSISTFNRVFKMTFNITPSEARKNKITLQMKSAEKFIGDYRSRINPVKYNELRPKFLSRDEFYLVGYRVHTSVSGAIPRSWAKLDENMSYIKNRANYNIYYGFEDYSDKFQKEPLKFYYMAAVEVTNIVDIPVGMHLQFVPASLYAVFTVDINNSLDEIGKAFRYIYDKWLPESDYCMSDEVIGDFEYYDERWKFVSPTSQIDIYVPIRPLGGNK